MCTYYRCVFVWYVFTSVYNNQIWEQVVGGYISNVRQGDQEGIIVLYSQKYIKMKEQKKENYLRPYTRLSLCLIYLPVIDFISVISPCLMIIPFYTERVTVPPEDYSLSYYSTIFYIEKPLSSSLLICVFYVSCRYGRYAFLWNLEEDVSWVFWSITPWLIILKQESVTEPEARLIPANHRNLCFHVLAQHWGFRFLWC